MAIKDLLFHPAGRAAQAASNLCFAAIFAWNAMKGRHIGTYLMLAFFAMTAVNIVLADARKRTGG